MIIDLHTHLWHSPDQLGPQIAAQVRSVFADRPDRLDAGPLAHEAAMEPVDMAVVLGFKSRYLGADVPNELIAEYVQRQPEKYIGFAAIDPTDPSYMAELERLPAMRMSGVTISPANQDFHPADTRAMRLYETCEAMGLPVLVHHGTHLTAAAKLEYVQPHLFDEVARSFGKLRLVIAHCGHPWIDEALVLIGKHEHVYAEISDVVSRPWPLYNVLLMAHQMEVMEKLLFGSGFPYLTPQEAIETIYSLNRFTHSTGLPAVPREKLRSIVERDTLACLGLKRGNTVPSGGRATKPFRNGVQETTS
jgi:predicted TIM-barrel fold metal-dependent hydrolase